ncbi:Trm112 family protein [bacterium]|nr:Trm112 family protein [candidate division CSSED10-310 bacterium]
MAVDQLLLDILVCPICKGPLVLTPAGDGLICAKDRLIFPIRDDIPVMLVDEALPLENPEERSV